MSFAALPLETMGAMATSVVPTMPGSSNGRPAPDTTASTPASTAVADRGRIILRCHHGVDGYHTGTLCNLLRLPDLGGQGTVIGACRVAGKVRLPVACIGGGDAPHAAAGCNGTGQPAEGNAHTHAAL